MVYPRMKHIVKWLILMTVNTGFILLYVFSRVCQIENTKRNSAVGICQLITVRSLALFVPVLVAYLSAVSNDACELHLGRIIFDQWQT